MGPSRLLDGALKLHPSFRKQWRKPVFLRKHSTCGSAHLIQTVHGSMQKLWRITLLEFGVVCARNTWNACADFVTLVTHLLMASVDRHFCCGATTYYSLLYYKSLLSFSLYMCRTVRTFFTFATKY